MHMMKVFICNVATANWGGKKKQSGCDLVYKPLHKHQERRQLVLIYCKCVRIPLVDTISVVERDNNSDKREVMLGQDQKSDEGVAGLGTKFTGNTNTLIRLSALLLLSIVAYKIKKRGGSSSHRVQRGEGQRYHLTPDCCVCCGSLVLPSGQRVQKIAPTSGSDWELVLHQLLWYGLKCPWQLSDSFRCSKTIRNTCIFQELGRCLCNR